MNVKIANTSKSILNKFTQKDKSNLIPILQAIQKEEGYISPAVVEKISKHLRVSKGHIYGVASFFSQFKFNPPGRHSIKICLGTACHVRGAQIIAEEFERELGIKAGETTQDLEFSFDTVNCVGACALGPVVIVDGKYHGQMNIAKAQALLEKIQGKTELKEL
ncbi:MAG: NAD(P)H-dependent oxidoreductase subunit E [Bacteroidales bacterium]|nr:NAD(P)H-dependent oxidoreductase subunit E [Bacteroidales bacterium]